MLAQTQLNIATNLHKKQRFSLQWKHTLLLPASQPATSMNRCALDVHSVNFHRTPNWSFSMRRHLDLDVDMWSLMHSVWLSLNEVQHRKIKLNIHFGTSVRIDQSQQERALFDTIASVGFQRHRIVNEVALCLQISSNAWHFDYNDVEIDLLGKKTLDIFDKWSGVDTRNEKLRHIQMTVEMRIVLLIIYFTIQFDLYYRLAFLCSWRSFLAKNFVNFIYPTLFLYNWNFHLIWPFGQEISV